MNGMESRRLWLLRNSTDPDLKKSSAGTTESSQLRLCDEIKDPKCRKSRTNKAEPRCASDCESGKSSRCKESKAGDRDPIFMRLTRGGGNPDQVKDRTNRVKSKSKWSNASRKLPKSVTP